VGKVNKNSSAKSQSRLTKHVVAGQKPTAAKCSKADSAASGSVTLNRRADGDRRKGEERRKATVAVAQERRCLERREKVNRRRQIDPTTCERNYNVEEIEFMNALETYKRASGRMFPTCSEILEVLRGLGYEKRPLVAPTAPILPSEQGLSIPADTQNCRSRRLEPAGA